MGGKPKTNGDSLTGFLAGNEERGSPGNSSAEEGEGRVPAGPSARRLR